MEYVLRPGSTITDAYPIVDSGLEAHTAGNGGAYRGLLGGGAAAARAGM